MAPLFLMTNAFMGFSGSDLAAAGWFLIAWAGYSFMVERTALHRHSLNSRMDAYRHEWMMRMIERENRIVDTTIMASLQNGTAFFASTSLIALGGALSLLRSPDEVLEVFAALPFAVEASRTAWELKVIGLAVIFAYAFFKFAWAYRIMNYAAILIGAAPITRDISDPGAISAATRAAAMNTVAGRHFNRGQRAFFFALGYLGWFIGPAALALSTLAILVVMSRRQFASDSLSTLDGKAS
jgi:uncharacterized membrane protein